MIAVLSVHEANAITTCRLQYLFVWYRDVIGPSPEATKFGEITQNNGHYAVQGHSRSSILVPIESSYATSISDYTLPPILHRFQVMVDYWSNCHYRHGSVSL